MAGRRRRPWPAACCCWAAAGRADGLAPGQPALAAAAAACCCCCEGVRWRSAVAVVRAAGAGRAGRWGPTGTAAPARTDNQPANQPARTRHQAGSQEEGGAGGRVAVVWQQSWWAYLEQQGHVDALDRVVAAPPATRLLLVPMVLLATAGGGGQAAVREGHLTAPSPPPPQAPLS